MTGEELASGSACSECGVTAPSATEKYCRECGAPLAVGGAPSSGRVCAQCGVTAPSATEKYCRECGAMLHNGAAIPALGSDQAMAMQASSLGATGDPAGTDSLLHAGFGIRAAARLIDLVVVFALALVTGVAGAILVVMVIGALGRPTQPAIDALGHGSAFSGWGFVIALVAALTYHAVAEAVHGSTPGKMVLGLTVLRDSGDFCTLGAALTRDAAYYIDGLFFGAIAYLSMRESHLQQRLGDKWARTVVVRRSSLQPAQRRSKQRFAGACTAACLSYAALMLGTLLIRL